MKTSVVIPAFNAERYLAEAIESVRDQRLPAMETIVVNDGSMDGTRQVAASYGKTIVYIEQANQGVSRTRNRGASVARGDWLLFLDADDRLDVAALERMARYTNEDDYGVVYGAVREFDDESEESRPRGGGNSEGLAPYPAKANFSRSLIVTPGAALVRRKLHERIGGFHKPWQPTEDRDYWLKLGVLTGFKYCSEIVLHKRRHASQSIRKLDQTRNLGMLVQLEFFDWLKEEGIDPAFLDSSPEAVADTCLKRAFTERRWHALGLMLDSLDEKRIETSVVRRMRLANRVPRRVFSVLDACHSAVATTGRYARQAYRRGLG